METEKQNFLSMMICYLCYDRGGICMSDNNGFFPVFSLHDTTRYCSFFLHSYFLIFLNNCFLS